MKKNGRKTRVYMRVIGMMLVKPGRFRQMCVTCKYKICVFIHFYLYIYVCVSRESTVPSKTEDSDSLCICVLMNFLIGIIFVIFSNTI